MAIGVYDYDFFNHKNSIPNLECGKLISYYTSHNQIAALAPTLSPDHYTKLYVRKEYNDGVYPPELRSSRCEMGGQAFAPPPYIPFAREIELAPPIFLEYLNYAKCFGATKTSQAFLKRLVNASHLRLAPFGELLEQPINKKSWLLILHDYNLGEFHDVELYLQDLLKTQPKCRIINKFPIQIFNEKQLWNWLKLPFFNNGLNLQFNGFLSNYVLYTCYLTSHSTLRQLVYNPTISCADENDFIQNMLPNLYKQVLFLRKTTMSISLIFDQLKITTTEVRNFIKLLDVWLEFPWWDESASRLTLAEFCSRMPPWYAKKSLSFEERFGMTPKEMYKCVKYISERNEEVGKMIRLWSDVHYEKEDFIDERYRS